MAVTEYTETRLEKRQNPAIMCTPSQSDAKARRYRKSFG
jgi:hypothetical protein